MGPINCKAGFSLRAGCESGHILVHPSYQGCYSGAEFAFCLCRGTRVFTDLGLGILFQFERKSACRYLVRDHYYKETVKGQP